MPPAPIQSAPYRTVSLADINLQNDDFRITTREDVDDLALSIRQISLITPPILIQQTSGYEIVSGFRRIAACRQLGWHAIAARILAESESHHLNCLRLSIAENALQRPLNLIETSRAFHKLSSCLGSRKHLAETASACGLPTNESIIDKIISLCLLPPPVQRGILNDTISLTVANELATLEPDVAVVFARLFEQLKLSLNKQREVVTLISEIARREDISIRQAVANETLQHIIHDEDLDRGQKGRLIRTFLHQWRFPRLAKAEKDYAVNLKYLKLGHDIQLLPPKEFEGTNYKLSLNFSSITHLKLLLSMLDKIIPHPSFERIIEGQDSTQTKIKK
jgi:ParB family chromosome partitioning protein